MNPHSKEFDLWNERKKSIDSKSDYSPLYHAREIRWCRLGINVGFEQDGTGAEYSRPILILKGFSRHVCVVLPLTTSTKKNPYHFPIGRVENREAAIILSQIRLIDTRRLDRKIMVLSKEKFEIIRKAVKDLL